MIVIQDFEFEIKPTKIVRGQGICRLAIESRDIAGSAESGWKNQLSLFYNEVLSLFYHEVLYIPPNNESWYLDLYYFIHHVTCSYHLNSQEKTTLRLKYSQYHLINLVLFRKTYDEVLLICLEKDDV